jgi:hemoglobin/transferrin/lactoferrin receptor protein
LGHGDSWRTWRNIDSGSDMRALCAALERHPLISVNRHKPMIGLALSAGLAVAPVVRGEPATHPAALTLETGPALETVTVYARRIQPLARVAATVTVIDQEQIQRAQMQDVKQLVRYEPGLSVRSDPFRFGLDTFTVRGMTGNRVAVEVDGIPSAGGFSIGSYSDSGRSFVDLAFVKRVEVLRGPASSLYGSDAIGGVVAMTTLRPDDVITAPGGSGLRTAAGYTGDDGGWNAAILGAGSFGDAKVLIGYVYRTGNEIENAAGVSPNPRDYASQSVLAKVEYAEAPGGPLTVTAEGGGLQQDTSVDAFERLPGTRFASTVLLGGDDSGSRFSVGADQRLDPSASYDSATWRAYWQGTDTTQKTVEQRAAVPPRTPPVSIDRTFRYDDRTFGAEFTGVRAMSSGGWTHELTYGFEYAWTRLEEQRNGEQTNLTTGATTRTILGETFPLRDFPTSDVTDAGLFAQDEIRMDEGRWSVIPALRLNYYDLSPRPDALYRADNPHVPVVGLNDVSLSPKLGLTWQASASLAGFFQYSNGFRAPPPEDVNIGLELPLFNVRAVPNPDLKPEQSNGFELGARWNSPALSLTASGYYNDYHDFIESKVNLGADPVTQVILFQSQNIASARIYGTEVSVTARLGEWSQLANGWLARLSAAYARGEDLERDEPLNSVDPASGVASLGYEAASGRWGGELVATIVAAKRRVDRSRVDLYRTDSYATLDLLGHVDLGHGLWLDAGLFNLTDRAYIEWADVRGRPVGDPLIPYYTHPGRNVSVTLRWSH